MEEARGGQDEETEVPTDREEQANERRAGGGCRRQPGILTLTLQSPSQIPYQPSQGCSVGEGPQPGESPHWAHRCWDARSACSRLCNAFPSRGSPSLPPFRNPIFYLSCLSGLGYNRGDSSPSSRPRAGPKQPSSQQGQPCFLFPHQHTSCPGSAPARTSSHRERRRGKKQCWSAWFPVQAGLLQGVQASESFF